MRALAGSILFLAAAIALTGGLVAEAVGKSNYGYGTIGMFAAVVMGGLGLAVLLSEYARGRKE
ncbi:MAG TPA: hypothetical protein VKE74_30655 [Gemmataceae bacterium]|nr:hypothetical protein [Gemmataceae bacterium]